MKMREVDEGRTAPAKSYIGRCIIIQEIGSATRNEESLSSVDPKLS